MISVIGVSGGKDSTALWLWARRIGLAPQIPLFADTQWEAKETYDYLAYLESQLGPIRRVVAEESFRARVIRAGTFPSRVRKWCSPELKVEPTRLELDKIRNECNDDVQMLIGFRREESAKRADPVRTPEREWSDVYDCEVWRPILDWTISDVIAEHHRAGIVLNPLYLRGAERVGCWPCIHAPKSELRLIAEQDPARIEEVAELERTIGQTMFAVEQSRKGLSKDAPRRVIPLGIHAVVQWARTDRSGRELAQAPATGCLRWGTCELPTKAEE